MNYPMQFGMLTRRQSPHTNIDIITHDDLYAHNANSSTYTSNINTICQLEQIKIIKQLIQNALEISNDTLIELIRNNFDYAEYVERITLTQKDIYLLKYFSNLIYLDCSNTDITYIPFLNKLRCLLCQNCSNITIASHFANLEKLFCSNCRLIKKIPNLINLTYLDCSGTEITELPYLPNLVYLSCSNTKIAEIPFYEKLSLLCCSNTRVTSIPLLNITYLECSLNDIIVIPQLKYLKYLECNSCVYLTEIEYMKTLECLICNDCPSITGLHYFDHIKHFENKDIL